MQPGFIIDGKYRLDHHIAVGGMGSVWRGFDLRLERDVAVKLLLRGLSAADKPGERFSREAKALARVKHPGFVVVHDVGEHSEGDELTRYIVMEYVAGESLKERIDHLGRLDPGEVLVRIAEAAEALDAAHGAGVVHRDVKPGNLLIDADGRTRVVDFGISTLFGATRLTHSSAVLGTLLYVSPEQFEDRETTAKSDIYALGAVAYEGLTGRPPFHGESQKAIISGHLLRPPPPLPDSVPESVAAIVLRALEKDPEDRWESAAELAAACRAAASSLAAGSGVGSGRSASIASRASSAAASEAGGAGGTAAGESLPLAAASGPVDSGGATHGPGSAGAASGAGGAGEPVAAGSAIGDSGESRGESAATATAAAGADVPAEPSGGRGTVGAAGEAAATGSPAGADAPADATVALDRSGPSGPSDPSEQPRRRRRRAALLLSVAVVVALLLSLVVWQTWPPERGGLGAESGTEDAAGDDLTDPSATPAADESSSGEPTSAEPSDTSDGTSPNSGTSGETEGGGNDGSGSGSDPGSGSGTDPGSGSTSTKDESPPASSEGKLPDYTGGTLSDAKSDLVSRGYTNVAYEVVFYHPSMPGPCEVIEQDPSAGSTVGLQEKITISYYPSYNTTC